MGSLPTFLIIGAQKSATRWLRMNLDAHPEIYAAQGEPSFFNTKRFFSGIEEYADLFSGGEGLHIRGEATPGYMMWRKDPLLVPCRIRGTIPTVRLIALLRDPVERAYSAFLHHQQRARIGQHISFLEYVRSVDPERDRLKIIAGGWYGASLEPFLALFGDSLLILLQTEVAECPDVVYRRASQHVGASTDFLPPDVDRVRHSNQGGEAKEQAVSEAARSELLPFFTEDIAKLERSFGLELNSWR